jgi:hypothetical protein
MIEQLKTKIG